MESTTTSTQENSKLLKEIAPKSLALSSLEISLVANFASHLARDKTIDDFRISSNNNAIFLEVESDTLEKYTFQCQISEQKELTCLDLKLEGSDFCINTQFVFFKEVRKKIGDHKLIFLTNAKLSRDLTELLIKINGETLSLKVVSSKVPKLLEKFNIKECLRFMVQNNHQYDEFFENFFFCRHHDDDKVDEGIHKYVTLIYKAQEKLNKKRMQRIIAINLLDSSIHGCSFGIETENGKLFQKAMSKFDFTVFKKVEKTHDDEDKLQWVMGDGPLVVERNSYTHQTIDLLNTVKFIQWVPTSNGLPKGSSVFHRLSDLQDHQELYYTLIKLFQCELPLRISLEELIAKEFCLLEVTTTDDLAQMLEHPYQLKDHDQMVPKPYIDRSLSKTMVDVKYLQEVDPATCVIITNVCPSIQKTILRPYNTSFDKTSVSNLYLLEKECPKQEFERLSYRNKYHVFDAASGVLEWVKSTGDVSDLVPHCSHYSFSPELSLSQKVNLIVGATGSGKSTFLKNLTNTLKSRFWTLYLSPKDISSFCRSKTFDFLLKNRTPFEKCLLRLLYRDCATIFLWDGLDELSPKNLTFVANFIKRGESKHWITCRPYMRTRFESLFGVLGRSFEDLNQEQKECYLQGRLKNDETRNMAQKFVMAPGEVLGEAIQLFLLTELLLEEQTKYSLLLEDQFSVADLYSSYVGEKVGVDLIGHYQEVALVTLFDKRLLYQLGLKTKTIQNDSFWTLFPHASFMDYFAATYLVQNYQKLPSLKSFLFESKYTNLRFFFDLLLAGKSQLHVAALYRNFDLVKNCVDETEDSGGRNVLQLICSWGRRCPTLKGVEKNECFLVYENRDLGEEETSEYKEIVGYLLEKCDVTKTDAIFKMAALDFAEASESVFAFFAIQRKCKTLFESKSPEFVVSCLYYSVRFGYYSPGVFPETKFIKIVRDVSALKPEGNSLLHLAIESGQLGCLEQLLMEEKFRRVINCRGIRGRTPLHLSSKKNYSKKDAFLLTQCLLTSGAEVDPLDEYGRTPLSYTAATGHDSLLLLLIDSGADVNSSTKSGRTPLTYASENGHLSSVKLLVQSGASLDALDHAPIAYAAANGHFEVVKRLSLVGADVTSPMNGKSPLFYATGNGHTDIIKFLLDAGVSVNTCGSSVFNANKEVLQLLISYGLDVDTRDICGWTLLFHASERGHASTVEMLISLGADVNAVDEYGVRALALASENGHFEVVELLVRFGALVDYYDQSGLTPLYYASKRGHEEIVSLLIQEGAEVNVRGTDGWTALLDAAARGHEEVVELLVNAGAEADVANGEGRTALEYATEKGFDRIAELLIRGGAKK